MNKNNPMYRPFDRSVFDELFKGLTDIMCYFQTRGLEERVLNEINIPKGISYPLLSKGVNLIANGAGDDYFNFVIDFEYNKLLHSNPNISDNELAELMLVKKSAIYLRHLDVNTFFWLFNSLCSNDIRSDIYGILKEVFKNEFDNTECKNIITQEFEDTIIF